MPDLDNCSSKFHKFHKFNKDQPAPSYSVQWNLVTYLVCLALAFYPELAVAKELNTSSTGGRKAGGNTGNKSPKYTLDADSIRVIYKPSENPSESQGDDLVTSISNDNILLDVQGNAVFKDYRRNLKMLTDDMFFQKSNLGIDLKANNVHLINTKDRKGEFELDKLYAGHIQYSDYKCKLNIFDSYLKAGNSTILYFSKLQSNDRQTYVLDDVHLKLCSIGRDSKKEAAPKEVGNIDHKDFDRGWNLYATKLEHDALKERVRMYSVVLRYRKMPLFYLPRFTAYKNFKYGITSKTGPQYSNGQFSLGAELFYNFSSSDKRKNIKNRLLIGGEFYSPFSAPSYSKRVTNYWMKYIHQKKNDHTYSANFHIAPFARHYSDSTGFDADIKESRYSFDIDVQQVVKKDLVFRGRMFGVSDRNFRKRYGLEFVNNLDSRIEGAHFGKDQYAKVSLVSYYPTFSTDADTVSALAPILQYRKDLTLKDKTKPGLLRKYSIDFEGSNSIRRNGSNLKRSIMKLNYVQDREVTKRYSYEFLASIRADLYSQHNLASGILSDEKQLSRAFGAIGIKNRIRTFSLVGDSGIVKFEPVFNIFYTQEGINFNNLTVEDMIESTYLNENTVFEQNSFLGYDYVEDGLNLAYGTKASVFSLDSKNKYSILFGQRFRAKALERTSAIGDTLRDRLSSYILQYDTEVMDGKINLGGSLLIGSNLDNMLSNTFKVEVSPLKWLTLGFRYMFRDQSIHNYADVEHDTKTRVYTIGTNLPSIRKNFKISVVEDANFILNNKSLGSKITALGFAMGHVDDCFKYNIGAWFIRYAGDDGLVKDLTQISFGVNLILK